VFNRRGSIEIVIPGIASFPAEQKLRALVGHRGIEGVYLEKEVPPDGKVVFDRLSPGEYSIYVHFLEEDRHGWRESVELSGEDGSLHARVEIDARPYPVGHGGIRGRLLEPDGVTPVELGFSSRTG
jgi:hypothetical protein